MVSSGISGVPYSISKHIPSFLNILRNKNTFCDSFAMNPLPAKEIKPDDSLLAKVKELNKPLQAEGATPSYWYSQH